MRIVASVQAKRGSSRGLVHYIAHSKLDVARESEKGRELFNDFADILSVKSANNSIKIGVGRARPSNDELHHLVLSFRPDDYAVLGRSEKARLRALKEVTRAAMSRLENGLAADRLSWAAAVHLNTGNPHVHIALQKQYFTREIERKVLTKIPREALPHYKTQEGEKVLAPGFLIEGAAERMEQLLDRDRNPLKAHDKHGVRKQSDSDVQKSFLHERDILRQGFLAEYQLHRIESKISELAENGTKIRFLVSDPESGRRTRLSLHDIEKRKESSGTGLKSPPETQIRTILFKMLAKAEAAKVGHQSETADTIREANTIKKRYRSNDWKLPTPSFIKDELDKLQDHFIQASEFRKFSYLEGVRSELESSGEIGPREKRDYRRIAAMKSILELREKAYEKNYLDLGDRRYYRLVETGDRRVSLAQLDREESAARNPVLSFVERLKEAASRLSGKTRDLTTETDTDRLRNAIVIRLNEQLDQIKRDRKIERKKSEILGKIARGEIAAKPIFSPEQVAEIDALSLRLKVKPEYEKNWVEQRSLIGSAGNDCSAYWKIHKANPSGDFAEYKTRIIAGRALAKEIMAKVELEKVKEDLNKFAESKRFQKFGIEDKRSGAIEFVSLHDVDLPKRGSLLDHAVDELFESREHRRLRSTVTSLVNDREMRLKEDVAASREIAKSAARYASEFKEVSLFGLRIETLHQPVFTSSEIVAIEMRITGTHNPKEAARLRTVLESAADKPVHSLAKMLRDFENPEITPAKDREAGSAKERHLGDSRGLDAHEREQERAEHSPKTQRVGDRAFPDILR